MHSERLRHPHQWGEIGVGSDPLDNIHMHVMRRVVSGAYPEAFKEIEDIDDAEAEREALEERYGQALHDFGFAQSRGLEFALVSLAATACEARQAEDRCADCPLAAPNGGYEAALSDLRHDATTRNLSRAALAHILERGQRYAIKHYRLIAQPTTSAQEVA